MKILSGIATLLAIGAIILLVVEDVLEEMNIEEERERAKKLLN